jgi:uncharacterized protein YyaL (SSP411 family)
VTNRLDQETSPYLLQHRDNPVDWWPWSDEAFDEARRRNVPIFLSIGYSACHWCHVMAHESFEDEATAAYLNEHYVSIKVDREERPDVDAIYMDATIAMTGHGGWPMSVFLDLDARPFYAGTYFPPEPRHQMPSFGQILQSISTAWTDRRSEVESTATRMIEALRSRDGSVGDAPPPDDEALKAAIALLEGDFDTRWGGFGSAPKFPPSMLLEFLLREAARTRSLEAITMAEWTLTAMARGGIYDQLGGGFARYSVDAEWVVPHFEKMLYDNALLLRDYAHWWRLTRSPLAERVVRETAEFLLREMRTPEGAFASALDADSEGEEGRFYSWTPEQLIEVLGPLDGDWAATLFTVTAEGTFEHGASTLQLPHDPEDWDRWARVRAALMAARDLRVRPGRDEKVVAEWNGLAIAALADAGAIFDEPAWIDAAARAAGVITAVHLGASRPGRLSRTSRDGRSGRNDGVLSDYGGVAEGFVTLFQVTGDARWLEIAGQLIDVAVEHFADGDGGFFDTADDAQVLVRRPRDPADSAEPSGWFSVANACVSYSAITGEMSYRAVAERALGVATLAAQRSPRAAGSGLSTASALLAGPLEIAIVGDPGADDTAVLRRIAFGSTSPGAVVAIAPGADSGSGEQVPLLRDRPLVGGGAAAYVCRGFVCQRPETSAEGLAQLVQTHPAFLPHKGTGGGNPGTDG